MERRTDIGFYIKRIHDGMRRHIDLNMRPQDMTFSQLRTLRYVSCQAGERATQKQVEEHFQVSHATVTGLLKRLSDKGLVRCGRGERDRRVKTVCLTDAGRAFLSAGAAHHEQTERVLLRGFTPGEAETLCALLRRVDENIQADFETENGRDEQT